MACVFWVCNWLLFQSQWLFPFQSCILEQDSVKQSFPAHLHFSHADIDMSIAAIADDTVYEKCGCHARGESCAADSCHVLFWYTCLCPSLLLIISWWCFGRVPRLGVPYSIKSLLFASNQHKMCVSIFLFIRQEADFADQAVPCHRGIKL
jgi:hypothetical protein